VVDALPPPIRVYIDQTRAIYLCSIPVWRDRIIPRMALIDASIKTALPIPFASTAIAPSPRQPARDVWKMQKRSMIAGCVSKPGNNVETAARNSHHIKQQETERRLRVRRPK